MKREDKKLFDDRFKIFWSKLTKKKKLNDEQKAYYQKTMLNHFKELMKILDVYRSLFYVFNIPVSIINFNERSQLRRSKDSYTTKNYRAVIKYYLENDVTEYEACKVVSKEKSESLKHFINKFRKWYKDIWNQDSYPEEIYEYLKKLNQRK